MTDENEVSQVKTEEVTAPVEKVEPKTKSDAGSAPKVMPIISIGVVEGTNELAVSGMIQNKRMCLNALADAIKIITNLKPQDEPGIVVPKTPSGIIIPGH